MLMSSLLTNGAAAGQRLNPNYLFLQAFGGVLSNKLEVSVRNAICSITLEIWAPCKPSGCAEDA